jgi:hypothetical protein
MPILTYSIQRGTLPFAARWLPTMLQLEMADLMTLPRLLLQLVEGVGRMVVTLVVQLSRLAAAGRW